MCTGFCESTTVISVPSEPTKKEGYHLSPAEALQNEAFLSAFWLPFAFYLIGISKGIVLKFLKRI